MLRKKGASIKRVLPDLVWGLRRIGESLLY